jgi:hypothetical protein
MKKNFILLLALTVIITFGCKKKYDIYTDSDIITISGSNGSTGTVKISANTDWVISSTAFKWLSMTPNSGTANDIVTFTCKENMASASREAIVTISDKNGNAVKQIKVVQNGFAYPDLKIIVGATDGIYYSVDGGYTLVKNALAGQYVGQIVKSNAGFFAVSIDGVWRSPDGYGWENVRADSSVYCIAVDNNDLYVGTATGIFKSVNDGDTWTATSMTNEIRTIAVSGGSILAGNTTNVYYLPSGSSTWVSNLEKNISTAAISNNALYVGTAFTLSQSATGMWKSTNGGASWDNTSTLSYNIFSLVVTKKDTIYTGSGKADFFSNDRGFYRSYDGGTTWNTMNLNGYNITGIAKYSGYLFVGTTSYGLFVSIDDGTTWSKMNNTGITVNSVVVSHL